MANDHSEPLHRRHQLQKRNLWKKPRNGSEGTRCPTKKTKQFSTRTPPPPEHWHRNLGWRATERSRAQKTRDSGARRSQVVPEADASRAPASGMHRTVLSFFIPPLLPRKAVDSTLYAPLSSALLPALATKQTPGRVPATSHSSSLSHRLRSAAAAAVAAPPPPPAGKAKASAKAAAARTPVSSPPCSQ